MFPETKWRETLRFERNKIHCFLRDQSLRDQSLSFDFYPKAVYFECKFWISRSALLTFKTDLLDLRGLDPGESDVKGSPA